MSLSTEIYARRQCLVTTQFLKPYISTIVQWRTHRHQVISRRECVCRMSPWTGSRTRHSSFFVPDVLYSFDHGANLRPQSRPLNDCRYVTYSEAAPGIWSRQAIPMSRTTSSRCAGSNTEGQPGDKDIAGPLVPTRQIRLHSCSDRAPQLVLAWLDSSQNVTKKPTKRLRYIQIKIF